MQVKNQQLELDMEQQTDSKLGKEYAKAACCHLVYLTYIRVHYEKCWADEAKAGIKIAGTNINNLRYADDTTFMAESEEELKSLLMKLKEKNERACLKLNIKKTNKDHATWPHYFMADRGGKGGSSDKFPLRTL